MRVKNTVKGLIFVLGLLMTGFGVVMAASNPSWSLSMASDITTLDPSKGDDTVVYTYTVKNNTADTVIENPTIKGDNRWNAGSWVATPIQYIADSQVEVFLNDVNIADQCDISFDETYKNFTVKYNGNLVGGTDTLVVKNTVKLTEDSPATQFNTNIVLSGDNIANKSSNGKVVNIVVPTWNLSMASDVSTINPSKGDDTVVYTYTVKNNTADTELKNPTIKGTNSWNGGSWGSWVNIPIEYISDSQVEVFLNDVDISEQCDVSFDETYKNFTVKYNGNLVGGTDTLVIKNTLKLSENSKGSSTQFRTNIVLSGDNVANNSSNGKVVNIVVPTWSLSMASDITTLNPSKGDDTVVYTYTVKNNTADTVIENPTIKGDNRWNGGSWGSWVATPIQYIADSQVEVFLNDVNIADQCDISFDETYKNFTVKYNGNLVGGTDTLVVKNTVKLTEDSPATQFNTNIVLSGDNIANNSSNGKVVNIVVPTWNLKVAKDVDTIYTKNTTKNAVVHTYTIKNNTADTVIKNPSITETKSWRPGSFGPGGQIPIEKILENKVEVFLNDVDVSDQCDISLDETTKNFTMKYNGNLVGGTDTLVVKHTLRFSKDSVATKLWITTTFAGDNIVSKENGSTIDVNAADYVSPKVSIDKSQFVPLIGDNEVIQTTQFTTYRDEYENLVFTNRYNNRYGDTDIYTEYLNNTEECVEILKNGENITDQFDIELDENKRLTARCKNEIFYADFNDVIEVKIKTIIDEENYVEPGGAGLYTKISISYNGITNNFDDSKINPIKKIFNQTIINDSTVQNNVSIAGSTVNYTNTYTRTTDFIYNNPTIYIYEETETLDSVLFDLENIVIKCGEEDITSDCTITRYKTNGLEIKVNKEGLDGNLTVEYDGKTTYKVNKYNIKTQIVLGSVNNKTNIAEKEVYNVQNIAGAKVYMKDNTNITKYGSIKKNAPQKNRLTATFNYHETANSNGGINKEDVRRGNILFTLEKSTNKNFEYAIVDVYKNDEKITNKCIITETEDNLILDTGTEVLFGINDTLYIDYSLTWIDDAPIVSKNVAFKKWNGMDYYFTLADKSESNRRWVNIVDNYQAACYGDPDFEYTKLVPDAGLEVNYAEAGYNDSAKYTYTIDNIKDAFSILKNPKLTLSNSEGVLASNIKIEEITKIEDGEDSVDATDKYTITTNEDNIVIDFGEKIEVGKKLIITYKEIMPVDLTKNSYKFTSKAVFSSSNIDTEGQIITTEKSMTAFSPTIEVSELDYDKAIVNEGEVVKMKETIKIAKPNSHIEDLEIKIRPYYSWKDYGWADSWWGAVIGDDKISEILMDYLKVYRNGEDITDKCELSKLEAISIDNRYTDNVYAYGTHIVLNDEFAYGEELVITYPQLVNDLTLDVADQIFSEAMVTQALGTNKTEIDQIKTPMFDIVNSILATTITTDREGYIEGEKEKVEIDITQTREGAVARDIQADITNSQGIIKSEDIKVVRKYFGEVIETTTDEETGEITEIREELEDDITEQCVITLDGNSINVDTNNEVGYDEHIIITYINKLNQVGIVKNSVAARNNLVSEYLEEAITNASAEASITRNVFPSANLVMDKNFDIKFEEHKVVVNNKITNIEPDTVGKDIVITDEIIEKDIAEIDIDSLVITNNGEDITDQCEISYEDGILTIIPNIEITTNELEYSYEMIVDESIEETEITTTTKIDYYPEKSIEQTDVITFAENNPELSVEKIADKQFTKKGDVVKYTITLNNVGTGEAKGFEITDTLNYTGDFEIKNIDISKNGTSITNKCTIENVDNIMNIKSTEKISTTDTIVLTYDVQY